MKDEIALPWIGGQRLLTLLFVKRYLAQRLTGVESNISHCMVCAGMLPLKGAESAETFSEIQSSLRAIIPDLIILDLKLTKVAVDRLLLRLKGNDTSELTEAIEEISNRVNDELSLLFLYYLPAEKRDYYAQTELFGELFKNAFPRANEEIIEAGNCFALGRNTACVFHLMRAMEIGLRVLSTSLQIPPVMKGSEKNWGNMLQKIKAKLDSNDITKASDPTWQADADFFKKAYSYFEGVRQPIRNSTMHVESTYDETGAENAMMATKAFLSHLATKLSE